MLRRNFRVVYQKNTPECKKNSGEIFTWVCLYIEGYTTKKLPDASSIREPCQVSEQGA